jgi:type III pantothenate kinase
VSRLSHVQELPARVVENLIFEGLLTLAQEAGQLI